MGTSLNFCILFFAEKKSITLSKSFVWHFDWNNRANNRIKSFGLRHFTSRFSKLIMRWSKIKWKIGWTMQFESRVCVSAAAFVCIICYRSCLIAMIWHVLGTLKWPRQKHFLLLFQWLMQFYYRIWSHWKVTKLLFIWSFKPLYPNDRRFQMLCFFVVVAQNNTNVYIDSMAQQIMCTNEIGWIKDIK